MSTKLGKIIADFRTQLATKIPVAGTTATLQAATDDDGVALPSGQYYLTIDGDNSQKEHFQAQLSGTALTALYSVSRQGVLTSGSARVHRVGATVIISDFAHILMIQNLLAAVDNLDHTTPIKYDGVADMTGDTNKLATVLYVNNIAIAGAPDASTTTKGIAKLATAPASAANPIAVGDNDPRLPSAAQVGYIPTSGQKDALAGTSGTPSSSNKYVTDADTSGSGTIVRGSIIATPLIYGSGADSAATLDGSNTYSFMSKSGSDYTLTRDVYLTNLTINSGSTLNPAGFRIFVNGTLTINGTLFRDGNNGGNGGNGGDSPNTSNGGTAGSAGTAGAALADGSIKGSEAGKAGGAGAAGINGSAQGSTGGSVTTTNITNALGTAGVGGGAGGNGGAAGGNPGTTGGTTTSGATVTAPTIMPYVMPYMVAFQSLAIDGTWTPYKGSSQSSSGGGGSSGSALTTAASGGAGGGGGSGSPGGIIFIAAKTIVIGATGIIRAKGGNGGNGGNGGAGTSGGNQVGGSGGGGGGAAGNGGVIFLAYFSLTNSGSISVAGGTKGTKGTKGAALNGGSVGTDGADGTDGAVGTIYQITT